MREPLSLEYLTKTQRIILGLPKGPWEVEPSEHGLPDQVGPICFLETWSDQERVPVVEFIAFAREAMPRYVGEVARLKDQVRRLERQLAAEQKTNGGVRHG